LTDNDEISGTQSPPLRIPLLTGEKSHKPLLSPPQSLYLRSGHVVLAPGESVGLHSTGEREEMLIPLSGIGEMQVPGVQTLTVEPGFVLFNPPHTWHDVKNTGGVPLSYIYVVTISPEK